MLEGLDILALTGLEWVYDKVDDRYGTAAAWLVTIVLTAIFVGVAVGALVLIL
jgi:hypothetical protein